MLGLDISAWQGNISQTTWNNIHNTEGRDFIILRSSRGGTTGYYDQSNSDNNPPTNTESQRYDDPYFIQNINRVVTAGMYAGSYHFSRPDIIATTLNANGIPNSGTDEADHFIQMAGPWMRPGYLVPVHDFEAGDGARTDNEMAQFCIDFSNRIYEKMGIRPAIYTSGNYAANILGGASVSLRNQLAQPPANLPSVVSPCYPTLWSARWPNQADPNSIDVQNGEPKDSYTAIYGPWDDYGVTHPWKFWQYASTARLNSFNNGGSNLDVDCARGGIEFLRDQLVPAVWMFDGSGDWSTLTNWNSGQTAIAPVQGPGQVARVGTLTLPTPRLPGAAGSGTASGQHDTVILERPNANITVTLSTGTHNIRKLYMRETLNLTGGSLTVNYVPSADSSTNSAEFFGPVALSNSASFTVHTLLVDFNRVFNLAGGTLTFNKIHLTPSSVAGPASILMNGNVTMNPLANATGVITSSGSALATGYISLNGTRTFTIGNGTSDVDVAFDVPVGNGGLTKAGAGTLRLTGANVYANGTVVSAGRLLVNNTTGSGTGPGNVTVSSGGTLGGSGIISGIVNVNSGGTVSPGASIGTLTLNSSPVFGGTNFMEIDRNGSPAADKILLTGAGTLTYGGALVVTNTGATLVNGDTFTLFTANSGNYAGGFTSTILPILAPGLVWDLSGLTVNGTIKVVDTNLNTPPFITSHPQDLTVVAGNNAAFSVTAGGTSPLAYQWRFSGTNISGATQSSYTRATALANHAGPYAVVVTNTFGSITSSPALLTVTTPTDLIIDNPDAEVSFAGGWQMSSSSGDKFGTNYHFASTIIGGTSNATYRPFIGSAGYYDVSIWYPQGSNRATNAPWSVVYDGGNTNLAVDQTVNGGGWRLIAAARPFQTGTNGYVRLSNDVGYSGKVVMADAVRFTLVGPLNTPPQITAQPVGNTVKVGSNVTFTVTATGTAPLIYQWRLNTAPIPGATQTSYTRLGAQTGDAGNYSVVVTNLAGSVISSNALLTVLPPLPPYFQSIARLPDGRISLVITGEAGANLWVDRASNFVDWLQFANLINTNGTVQVIDDSATNGLRQFYRARE